MSTNPPDNDNKKDDKKDGACENTKKFVLHGAQLVANDTPRRKIIRAKRPPMSKTGFDIPTAPASASDTIPMIPPPADAGIDYESGELTELSKLVANAFANGLDESELLGALIKEDSAQFQQIFRRGMADPRFKEILSREGIPDLSNELSLDADQFKDKFMESLKLCGIANEHETEEQIDEHTEYIYGFGQQGTLPGGLVKVRFDPSVGEVRRNAFVRSRSTLKEVVMNEGLLKLDSEAFYICDALEEVIMPSTVQFIESSAFSKCYQLGKVELNEGLLQLGEWSFEGCINLESITIPSTLKCIDGYTFSGCVSLKEVSFGTGIESISHSAFAGCRKLRQVVFNDGLKKIGKDSFLNCINLNEVVMNETNIQSINCHAFRGCRLQKIILQSLSTRVSTIVQAGNTQVEGKLNSILGFYLGCKDEQIYLKVQAYASGGGGPSDLNLWKQIKDNYLGRIDDMLSFYERKEATIIFELAWWKNKIDNPEEDSPVSREECRTDIPGPAKDMIWQYLSHASNRGA